MKSDVIKYIKRIRWILKTFNKKIIGLVIVGSTLVVKY